MNEYYHILGVTPDASIDQIKKAYRKKAMLLHPDVNKAADAHEKFVLLSEAYQYLLDTQGVSLNRFKRAQEQTQKQADYQKYWEESERAKARQRAQEYARMKYEAYLQSDIYKTTEALNVLADLAVVFVMSLFLLVLPTLLYLEYGPISLPFILIIILPTSPIWFRFLVRLFSRQNFKMLISIKKTSYRSKVIKLILFVILNVILFFKISLNTLIELQWIYLIYGSAFVLGILVASRIKSRFYRYLIKFGVAPMLIHLFFITNYTFSSNPNVERYWYTYHSRTRSPLLPAIHLEGDAYEKYRGMRIIVNGENIIGHAQITYEFEDGLFGFRVVKGFTIE